jgi:hypothetical protein
MDLHVEHEAAMAWLDQASMDPAVVRQVLDYVADRLAGLQEQTTNLDELAGVIQATWLVETVATAAAEYQAYLTERPCASCGSWAEPDQRQCVGCLVARRPVPS